MNQYSENKKIEKRNEDLNEKNTKEIEDDELPFNDPTNGLIGFIDVLKSIFFRQ